MATVRVKGSSDDLVVLSGDLEDEFSPRDGEPLLLGFSDGTLLRVCYTNVGMWSITRDVAGSASFDRVPAEGPDGPNYSDAVTLRGDIRWAVAGERERRK
jgi:hypothetical protein